MDVRLELKSTTCILQEAMESVCSALRMDTTLECNFDRIYVQLRNAQMGRFDALPALGTIIYGHYVGRLCER